MCNILKLLLCFILISCLSSQTTGKISGKVTDLKTKEPIVGANVMLLNTSIGTSTDNEGNYYLINLSPKNYDVTVSVIGYKQTTFQNISVSVNRTTNLNFSIEQTLVEGDVVVVTANQVNIKKDQTSSVKNISSDMLDILPVENISSVINMQAGVVANHFRGGRDTEVTYLVDGVSVDENLGGNTTAITVDPSAVQDLEVITGTFNAEYGRAMSGVVNQISKEGSNDFGLSTSIHYANYFSDNNNIFPGIKQYDINDNIDRKIQISGPLLKNKIFYFINVRNQVNDNHLNGYHYFNPNDFSSFDTNDESQWYSEHTGEHVFESYCAEVTGNQILDENGNYLSKEECTNYGTCKVIFLGCFDAMGNEIASGGDNIEQVCQELGGTLDYDRKSFYFTYSGINRPEAISRSNCDLVSQFLSSQSGFVSTQFVEANWREKNDALVPMNRSKNTSLLGKLSLNPIQNLKVNLLYSENRDNWYGYSHGLKYNPFSASKESKVATMNSIHINYMINNSAFFDVRYSKILSRYNNYRFGEIIADNIQTDEIDGYVHDTLDISINGFSTGGHSRGYTKNKQARDNLKFDMMWQINKSHNLKFGFDGINHDNSIREYSLRDSSNYDLIYNPIIMQDTVSSYAEEYDIKSKEFSFYMQDKMEFNEMVINAGFRYDAFYPETSYPSDYRNPRNEILNQPQSEEIKARIKTQISPRFGLAYQVGDAAVMHFSYGHFFQMPPMYAMFANYDRIIPVYDFSTILGNPNLEAEKTVQYEIGIWQKLNSSLGLELNLYYRDIYNLLSTTVITTYNEVKYGLYTNKDYGNVRGLEAIFDFHINNISMFMNYTMQYTRGNADSPTQSFDFEGNNKDPVNILMPMSWDQRNTFNVTLTYSLSNFNIMSTAYFNSGTPYSYVPISTSSLANINLLPNNEYKPANYSVDITGSYKFNYESHSIKINFSVYNVFDRLNEYNVNSQTGRAGSAIITDAERAAFYSNFNTIEDTYIVPTNYSSPRNIKIGIQYEF